MIGLLKEIRRLVFPAYYGDPELMTLLAEDYTALLLERIEGQLTRQIALALPEEQEQRAPMLAREVVGGSARRAAAAADGSGRHL